MSVSSVVNRVSFTHPQAASIWTEESTAKSLAIQRKLVADGTGLGMVCGEDASALDLD
jgi:hypothetical protein